MEGGGAGRAVPSGLGGGGEPGGENVEEGRAVPRKIMG